MKNVTANAETSLELFDDLVTCFIFNTRSMDVEVPTRVFKHHAKIILAGFERGLQVEGRSVCRSYCSHTGMAALAVANEHGLKVGVDLCHPNQCSGTVDATHWSLLESSAKLNPNGIFRNGLIHRPPYVFHDELSCGTVVCVVAQPVS